MNIWRIVTIFCLVYKGIRNIRIKFLEIKSSYSLELSSHSLTTYEKISSPKSE